MSAGLRVHARCSQQTHHTWNRTTPALPCYVTVSRAVDLQDTSQGTSQDMDLSCTTLLSVISTVM